MATKLCEIRRTRGVVDLRADDPQLVSRRVRRTAPDKTEGKSLVGEARGGAQVDRPRGAEDR